MKKTTALFLLLTNFVLSQNQLDSIFTNSGALAVTIKEITEDAVKFSYPGEDLVNSIYKNTVFKIIHKSGRVEKFNEASSFKIVKGGDDWEKVSLTRVENELKGLFKLGEVSSKATGATVFSNVNTVKDRAFKKLKIETAMSGGNIVYILDQQTNGVTSYYGGSNPARTNLSGIAYSDRRPNFDEFQKILNVKSEFEFLKYQTLGNNSMDISTTTWLDNQTTVKLSGIRNNNGFIMVKANIEGEDPIDYRITYFDDRIIIFMTRDKNTIYNYVLKR